MNKRNKRGLTMESIFGGIITFAVMIALVAGIVSIVTNDGAKDGKNNYIDLNEIDLNQGAQNANNETQADNKSSAGSNQMAIETKPNAQDGAKTADGSQMAKDSTDKIDSEKESSSRSVADNTSANGKTAKDIEQQIAEEIIAAKNKAAKETQDKLDAAKQAADSKENSAIGKQGDAAGVSGDTAVSVNPTSQAAAVVEESEAAPVTASTATILGYTFGEGSSLMWPVTGDVLLNYNMDSTIYFPTLDAYKCNPAIVIASEEGANVVAAADGIVMDIYDDVQTGLTMKIAVGNDYVITYGQLKDLVVGKGSKVKRGDIIGTVAAPTKYYTAEGSNIYLRLDNNEGSVNPMDYLAAE